MTKREAAAYATACRACYGAGLPKPQLPAPKQDPSTGGSEQRRGTIRKEINIMKTLGSWTTGSERGYCHVGRRGVESDPVAITDEQRKLSGNHRYNMGYMLERYPDATHYTVTAYAGTSKFYSNQYIHYIYTFYKKRPTT
ncbi:MAG: hypothetical protein LBQ15_11125 [Clostridium sp.]|jgi:hypothetical protein|nr:hypothetical protein [Clostridium sp.]